VLAIRVTYVGELGWELHVPAEYAAGVYDDLVAAGGGLGFRPVGLQAMSGLRLEKGYRDMGVDIDNTDNPIEAGLGFAVAWDKPGGFIGRDALLKAREQGPPRHRVVSLTVGGPVGLAQVACDDGVTGQWLKEGDFRVLTPDREIPARLQIAPPYDPQRLRILDR
jgi:4-methylaminobutanoate oxidase (formaldehyde-forming)